MTETDIRVSSCLICGGSTEPAFSKHFDLPGLAAADYRACRDCGFVLSETHARMTPPEWTALNQRYHAAYQGSAANPDDPRWVDRLQLQADMLADLDALGVLPPGERRLDYACGDGKLSELLRPRNFTLLNFDRYMTPEGGSLPASALQSGAFDFVITTSVFEHLTRREHFDEIAALVSPRGVLGLHTLVSAQVPRDPSWFYLLPVHCAFHTNASMQRLFDDWGYQASIYNVEARLWLWFKDAAGLAERIAAAARREVAPVYHYADRFMDYWK